MFFSHLDDLDPQKVTCQTLDLEQVSPSRAATAPCSRSARPWRRTELVGGPWVLNDVVNQSS